MVKNPQPRNLMEDMVKKVFPEVRVEYPDFCGCERCEQDVIALALNKLGAKYVTSSQGETRVRVELDSRQRQIDTWLALRSAFEAVMKTSHHQRK